MKKIFFILVFVTQGTTCVLGQSADSTQWEYEADLNFYFFPDDFYVMPIFKADKNKLHLEARYNYEDRETVSAWIGYNISGGGKLEYTFTPMVGGAAGLTDGIAPGLEMRLNFKGFELYTETEVLFELSGKEDSFLYNWTEFTYSVSDRFWVGISGQRIRAYQNALDLQRGFMLGTGHKRWELTAYFYNPGLEEHFFLATLSLGF